MSVRFLKLVIATSLLINVLLLGVAFGHMGRSIVEQETQPHHRINVHVLADLLAHDKRQQLTQTLAKFDHDDKQLSDQLDEERRKLIALVTAQQFDKDAYQAQTKTIVGIHSQIAKSTADVVTTLIAVATYDEKTQISAKMTEMLLDKK